MVLVILAILAAILVPALLGWIDKAREKQYVLDARNVYVATQAYIDENYYAKGEAAPTGQLDADVVTAIEKLADTECGNITIKGYANRVNGKADGSDKAEISAIEITGLGTTASDTTGKTATLNWSGTAVDNSGWVIS